MLPVPRGAHTRVASGPPVGSGLGRPLAHPWSARFTGAHCSPDEFTPMAEWQILEPDVDTVLGNCADPFQALAAGTIPGVVVRNAYDAASCQTVIKRFVEDDLIPDPARPDTILDGDYQTVGHFRSDDGANRLLRIDIGTSLVNKTRLNADFEDPNRNREAFLEHSEGTYALFERLFDGLDDPVALYDTLRRLACGRIVQPAEEPDGRRYGPAIFRVHYAGQTYAPHINHVRRYDKLTEFAVTRFEYQFAGLICFQNPAATSDSPHQPFTTATGTRGSKSVSRLARIAATPHSRAYAKPGSSSNRATSTCSTAVSSTRSARSRGTMPASSSRRSSATRPETARCLSGPDAPGTSRGSADGRQADSICSSSTQLPSGSSIISCARPDGFVTGTATL